MPAVSVDSLELRWAEILKCRGDLVSSIDRGLPAIDGVPVGVVTRSLSDLVRAAQAQLEELEARGVPGAERSVVESIAASLPTLAVLSEDGATGPAAFTEAASPVAEDDATRAIRVAIHASYAEAAKAIRVGSETIDRLTVVERLTKIETSSDRAAHFDALEPVWRTVAGRPGQPSPYQRLAMATAARWASEGSPIDAAVSALGLTTAGLEPLLWSVLRLWRDVLDHEQIEPWDFRFSYGAAARRLHSVTTADRFQELNDAYLDALGVAANGLRVQYDIFPRSGRPEIPVAHAVFMGMERANAAGWRARTPWVFATYRSGGLANLAELLHESGHALHLAGSQARPAYADVAPWGLGWFEGLADVLGWDADEPKWQERWLGAAATPRDAILHRYGAVVLDICWALFEIAVYREPHLDPNEVWCEITGRGLGIVSHPDVAWWATRGQLISMPGYMVNYALSPIIAAAIRERMRATIGEWWTGDERWLGHLRDAFFATGFGERPATLLGGYLGGPLTIDPLLRDLGAG